MSVFYFIYFPIVTFRMSAKHEKLHFLLYKRSFDLSIGDISRGLRKEKRQQLSPEGNLMGNSKLSINAGLDSSTFDSKNIVSLLLGFELSYQATPSAVGSGSFPKFSYPSSRGRLYWVRRLIFGLYGVGIIRPNIKSGIKWVQLARAAVTSGTRKRLILSNLLVGSLIGRVFL